MTASDSYKQLQQQLPEDVGAWNPGRVINLAQADEVEFVRDLVNAAPALFNYINQLEEAVSTADWWAHAYVSDNANVCITCGQIGAYGHQEPEVSTRLRMARIDREDQSR